MLFTHGGALAKELSLRIPLAAAQGAHPTTLLHVLLHWLELATSHPPATTETDRGAPSSGRSGDGHLGRPAVDGRAAADAGISLVRLLCGWMYGCPAAVLEMLDNPANLFVVDVAAGRCSVLVEGGAAGGATAVQCVALKGLACLALGLLLEYVEGTGAPRSGGGGAGQWTRSLVMKMIQNRVGESGGRVNAETVVWAYGSCLSDRTPLSPTVIVRLLHNEKGKAVRSKTGRYNRSDESNLSLSLSM